ncbi:mechanosensitive ion channel family protein [Alphaproteobacteria bacterium]|nr:mechanosensitive ion channel family protein [Alphaproteobacteria bacterium]
MNWDQCFKNISNDFNNFSSTSNATHDGIIILLSIFILGLFYASRKKNFLSWLTAKILPKNNQKYKQRIYHHLCNLLIHVVAIALTYMFYSYFLKAGITIDYMRRLLKIYALVISTIFLYQIIDSFYALYRSRGNNQVLPLHGYIEAFRILLTLIVLLIIEAFRILLTLIVLLISASILLKKSLWMILSGVGASTALLLFIFKDSISGFISSTKLVFKGILREGDWIVIPAMDVEGIIQDIALSNICIRSFDNSYIYVPTFGLSEKSIRNNSNIFNTNKRRIKRAIFIDPKTVKITSPKILKKICDP